MEFIKLIPFESQEYHDAIQLRYEILRKPLGLKYTLEQLAQEKSNFHIGYYQNNKLIAYLMLEPYEKEKVKMKQVAVNKNWQGKGMGSKLVKFAEEFAKNKQFKTMFCHARDRAVPFYERLNYRKVGNEFLEVSIPHYYLEKSL